MDNKGITISKHARILAFLIYIRGAQTLRLSTVKEKWNAPNRGLVSSMHELRLTDHEMGDESITVHPYRWGPSLRPRKVPSTAHLTPLVAPHQPDQLVTRPHVQVFPQRVLKDRTLILVDESRMGAYRCGHCTCRRELCKAIFSLLKNNDAPPTIISPLIRSGRLTRI